MNKNKLNVIVYISFMNKRKFTIFLSILFSILYIIFLYNSFYFHKGNIKNLYKSINADQDKIIEIYNIYKNKKINFNDIKQIDRSKNFIQIKGNIDYKIVFSFYNFDYAYKNFKNIGVDNKLDKDHESNINSERFLFLKRNYNKYVKINDKLNEKILFKFESDGKFIFKSIFEKTFLKFLITSIILIIIFNYILIKTPKRKLDLIYSNLVEKIKERILKIINIKIDLNQNLNSDKKFDLVGSIILLGFLFSIFYYYLIESLIYPPSPVIFTPFHNVISIFCDYYSIDNHFHINGFDSSKNNYLPGSLLIIQILKLSTLSNPYLGVKIILVSYILFTIFYLNNFTKHLEKTKKIIFTTIFIFCCYPFLFTLHTANFEGFVFIGLALSFLYFIKRRYFLSGFLIGFATSLKIYPILFLTVYLKKNNLKDIILGTFCGFTILFLLPFLLSSIIFPYGEPIENINIWLNTYPEGLKFYKNHMVLGWSGVHFGHSLLNSIWLILGPNFNIANYYSIIVGFLFLSIFSGFIFLIKMNSHIYKFILCLCIVCLFAPTSTDYKLLHFMIPLIYLIKSKRKSSEYLKIIILICLLMISKSFIYFYDNIYANTNTLFNTLLLIYIGLLSVKADKLYGVNSLKDAIKKYF